jgi:hypothetical protein
MRVGVTPSGLPGADRCGRGKAVQLRDTHRRAGMVAHQRATKLVMQGTHIDDIGAAEVPKTIDRLVQHCSGLWVWCMHCSMHL